MIVAVICIIGNKLKMTAIFFYSCWRSPRTETNILGSIIFVQSKKKFSVVWSMNKIIPLPIFFQRERNFRFIQKRPQLNTFTNNIDHVSVKLVKTHAARMPDYETDVRVCKQHQRERKKCSEGENPFVLLSIEYYVLYKSPVFS